MHRDVNSGVQVRVKEATDTESKVKRRLEQLDELDTQNKAARKETTLEVPPPAPTGPPCSPFTSKFFSIFLHTSFLQAVKSLPFLSSTSLD